jgi:hypothetical protein
MGGYIGSRSVVLSTTAANVQDVTATDTTPEVTIVNSTHEDTDGGREGKVIFKGQQSGGEETTLAEIQGSHDGTSDDEKGDLIFRTNDGSDGASPTEAMRIDSSGNVGIGTTDPSNSRLNVSDTHTTTVTDASTLIGNATLTINGNSGQGSDVIRMGPMCASGSQFIDASNGAGSAAYALCLNPINGGSVGIGTTTPMVKLHVHDSSSARFALTNDTTGQTFPDGFELLATGADAYVQNRSNGNMIFTTNNAERTRIDSSGNLLVGTTSNVTTGSEGIELRGNAGYINTGRNNTGSVGHFLFYNPNGNVGSITTSGSSTSFNTSSDYRLKENVTDISDGITRLKQLQPRRFNFIADADTTVDGFIAHETQAVVAEAVHGTKDELEVWAEGEELPDGISVGDNKLDDDGNTIPKMQGIDQAKLVPLLTAALQEAIAKIETLETQNTTQATQIADLITRVTALEAE